MANKTLSARIAMTRDTEQNWNSKNPVLLAGEFAVVSKGGDYYGIKIGDGSTAFADLPYAFETPEYTVLPISQTDYDNLTSPDSNTLYVINV